VPMEGMDGATRRRAKAINFGIIYGISASVWRGNSHYPGGGTGLHQAVFRTLSGHPRLHGARQGRRETRRVRDNTVRPALLDLGHRRQAAGAAVVRGTTGDQRAVAGRCGGHYQTRHGASARRAGARVPSARMLLQVHDELVFEVPAAEAPNLSEVAKRVMEHAAVLSVPLVVETGFGRSWSEAH